MRLKTSYSAREVAALTGLTARQLQGWDETRVFQSAIAPRRTSQGGFTERRYSPVDVLELVALAELRRRGFTPAVLRQMMDTLREYFRRRLSETLDDAGDLRLLTDGHGLFLRTRQGHIFDLLVDPQQPLVTGDGLPLSPVVGRARRKARSLKPEARSKR
ncbi:MAG TPA: MerR family transcriptional regulator [Vicinamibacterales bacterium]|jgi:DNA-binding transcriptional MerR regulator|nr:MerR family transcriptional regulator [Vicinamibacterales bacterium]